MGSYSADMENDTDKNNYYSILNCDQCASYEELKQSYQELIRKYHPDKRNGFEDTFLIIDKAWKTLRDENLRKEYDIYLKTQLIENNTMIHAELTVKDLTFDDKGEANYPCRCGNNFLILSDYIVEEKCIIECNECSNCISIKP